MKSGRSDERLARQLAARLDAGLLAPAADDDAELQDLLAAYARLQDEAAEPDPGFYRRLRRAIRRQAEEPEAADRRPFWPRLLAWPHWRPAALVVAAAVVILALVPSLLTLSGTAGVRRRTAALVAPTPTPAAGGTRTRTYPLASDDATSDDTSVVEYKAASSADESEDGSNLDQGTPDDGAAPQPDAGGAQDRQDDARMVIRQAALALVVQDTAASLARLEAIAADLGGGVYNSETGRTQQGNLYTTASIRVPAENFERALAQVRALDGELISERIGSQDVTAAYVDLEARLRNLELAEQELRELQDSAQENGEKASGILAIHRELTEIRQQIEQIKGQMSLIERSVAMAQIEVALVPEEIAPEPPPPPGFDPGRVLDEAWEAVVHVLEDIATGLLWALAFAPIILPPVGVVALVAWLVARRVRRRGAAGGAEDEEA